MLAKYRSTTKWKLIFHDWMHLAGWAYLRRDFECHRTRRWLEKLTNPSLLAPKYTCLSKIDSNTPVVRLSSTHWEGQTAVAQLCCTLLHASPPFFRQRIQKGNWWPDQPPQEVASACTLDLNLTSIKARRQPLNWNGLTKWLNINLVFRTKVYPWGWAYWRGIEWRVTVYFRWEKLQAKSRDFLDFNWIRKKRFGDLRAVLETMNRSNL